MKANCFAWTAPLKNLEFELGYLALLTREGLKPLSRWEKDYGPATEPALQALGLKTRRIERTVRSGRRLRELLFSISEPCLDSYSQRFDGTPVDHHPGNMRFEGRLFGYPPCCVESFIAQGYARNALRRRDQRILFHWACPRCAVTPRLLPEYRRIHRACRQAIHGRAWAALSVESVEVLAKRYRRAIAMAASLVALGGIPAIAPAAAPAPDPSKPHRVSSLFTGGWVSDGLDHFVAEPEGTDNDNDGLRNWEEPELGSDPEKPDTDGDGLLDGIDLARALRTTLDTLPRKPQVDQPYVIEHPMDGYELCPRCGERVVMDLWEVIHPVTSDAITVPSMALHFMRHGGFGWSGGQLLGGQGRIDPRQLLSVLTGRANHHLLKVTPDSDHDLITDVEEQQTGKDPAIADEDGNTVRDGLDLARTTACEIAGLPTKPDHSQVYRLDFPLKGLEQCEACGTNVNMGHLTICNPMAQLYAKLPYITLHYLEHDSFSFAGNVHGQGRTEVKLLLDALHSKGPAHGGDLPGDTDADGLTDLEERHFGTDPEEADSNQDGVPDGFTLARVLWRGIESRPRLGSPPVLPPNGASYVVDHLLRGVIPCPVCGIMVNMGWVEVINPRKACSMDITYLNLHYLEQGGFGDSTVGRVDLVQWGAILQPAVLVTLVDGQVTLRWMSQVGHTYQVFSAADVAGPWTPGEVLKGDGNELVFTESQPAGSGRRFYKVTDSED